MSSAEARRPGVRVAVPASSANLGPGFDVLALALGLVNTYEAWEVQAELRIEVMGEGEGIIPRGPDNLFLSAMNSFFALAGYQPSGLLIREHNRIPLGRGLGSSAATIVGGLLAARALSGHAMADDRILDMARSLEGHPDNVAAALYGGLVLVVPEEGEHLTVRRLEWPEHLGCAIFVPDRLVSTDTARSVLPDSYQRADVIHNLARVALLVAAIEEGRTDDLVIATEDRLHQPYRQQLVPGLEAILAAALEAGATGAFLSGAGPSVMALFDRRVAGQGGTVGEAMFTVAAGSGVSGRSLIIDVSSGGAATDVIPELSGEPA